MAQPTISQLVSASRFRRGDCKMCITNSSNWPRRFSPPFLPLHTSSTSSFDNSTSTKSSSEFRSSISTDASMILPLANVHFTLSAAFRNWYSIFWSILGDSPSSDFSSKYSFLMCLQSELEKS